MDLRKEFERYDGLGLAALVRAGEVTATEVLEAAIERIEARNPAVNAVVARMDDQARARHRRRAARGPLHRRALSPQGPRRPLHRRGDLGRQPALRRLRGQSRQRDHGPAPARRAGDRGEVEHARDGDMPVHRAPPVRAHPQPVAPRPQRRRVQRWRGRGGGRRHDAHGACHRRRRLDPHPRLVLRPVRAQAHPRTRSDRAPTPARAGAAPPSATR